MLVGLSGSRTLGRPGSTANLEAIKDEIFSLACVKLDSIRLIPTIGGK